MKLRCEDLCALESLLKSDAAARATARRSSSDALDCLLARARGIHSVAFSRPSL